MVFPIGRSAVWPPPLWHHHRRLCCGPPPWGVSHSSADHSRRHDVSAMGLCFTGRLIWISENRWCLYIQNLTSFNQKHLGISTLLWFNEMIFCLQQMAVRCWCLKFQSSDHQFLHECHVFSNISRILSKSEEEREENGTEHSQVRKHWLHPHLYTVVFFISAHQNIYFCKCLTKWVFYN